MYSQNKLNDHDLIALLKNGDKSAFEVIYKRYWTVMYSQALRMLKNEEDSRDVVQELFTSLWLKGHTLSPDINLAGYLYVATKNKVLDLIAQNKVRVNYLESLAIYLQANAYQATAGLSERELMLALENEIQHLPAKMKQIFEMRMKEHLTYKEIAEALTISDKTVKKQVSNAIKLLHPKLHQLSFWLIIATLCK